MSFLAFPPNQARPPFAEVLPDGRKRITQWFRATTIGTFPPEIDYAVNSIHPWGQAPTGWDALRLTYKQMDDDARGFPQGGDDGQALVRLIWEEISETAETQVGNPTVVENQYGYLEVTYEWVQFSSNAFVPQTVGTTTASAPWAVCVLRDEEAPDDGTLRHIKRTYVEGGELSDISEIRFNGRVTVRTLKYLNEVPPTPSGYTLVGPGVEYINGLPVYTYQFVKASASDGTGTGAEISRSYTNSQGGDVAFPLTTPNTATGEVICTIRYITTPAITSNPVTQPTSFVLFAVDVTDESGFRMWETKSGFGGNNSGANNVLIDLRTEADGALIYTYQSKSLTAATPAYTGSGTAPLVKIENVRGEGFYTNTAVYHKLPASIGFRKMVKFLYPGLASFSGAPVLYGLIPPVTMDILATVTVDYDTSQVTTTPFTVTAYSKLNVSWIPYTNPGTAPTPGSPPADTTVGPPQGYTESLGGYLAGASGISDDDQYFNGVFVATYSATLSSSTPSTRPSGATTIAVDNDPYVISTAGTQYFRRTVTTYSF